MVLTTKLAGFLCLVCTFGNVVTAMPNTDTDGGKYQGKAVARSLNGNGGKGNNVATIQQRDDGGKKDKKKKDKKDKKDKKGKGDLDENKTGDEGTGDDDGKGKGDDASKGGAPGEDNQSLLDSIISTFGEVDQAVVKLAGKPEISKYAPSGVVEFDGCAGLKIPPWLVTACQDNGVLFCVFSPVKENEAGYRKIFHSVHPINEEGIAVNVDPIAIYPGYPACVSPPDQPFDNCLAACTDCKGQPREDLLFWLNLGIFGTLCAKQELCPVQDGDPAWMSTEICKGV